MRRNTCDSRAPRTCRLVRAAAVVVMSAAAQWAAADTWDNSLGNNLWSSASNWADNSEPLSGDPVIFPDPLPPASLGSFTVNLSGGEVASSLTFNRHYELTGGSLTLTTGNISVASSKDSYIYTQLQGTAGLNKGGNGDLYLQIGGSNTFTGGVNVSAGRLGVFRDDQLGNPANNITLNGFGGLATLDVHAASFATSRVITIGAFGGTIETQLVTFTLNSGFSASSGSNPLYIKGIGTLALNASTTRSGNTYISGSTVRLNNGAALGTGGDLISGTGVLEIAPGIVHSNIIFLDSGATLRTGGAGAVHNDTILVQASGSSVFLNTGPTTNSTLQLGGPGTNQYTGGSGAKTIVNGLGRVTILTTNNDYEGDWQIDSGTLRFIGVSSLGSGTSPVVVNNTGTLQLWSVTFSRDVTLNNGSTLAFETIAQSYGTNTIASGAAVTMALKNSVTATLGGEPNGLTGGGGGSSILVTSDGTVGNVLRLHQPSNYTGNWTIGTGATVEIDADNSLGNPANAVLMSIGTLRSTQSFSTSRAFQTEFGTFEVTNGSTLTLAAGMGTGGNPVTKSGDGTLVLAADSARTGGLTIIGGTVVAQTPGALGGTGIASTLVNNTGTLEIDDIAIGKFVQLSNGSALRGTGSNAASNGLIAISSNSAVQIGTGASPDDVFTIGGAPNKLQGGGGTTVITVNGAGKVVLTHDSSYTGGWNISSGTLEISANNQLGDLANSVSLAGGTLSTTEAFTSARTFTGAGGTLSIAPGKTLTITSALAGSGSITKSGTGTLALTGSSTRIGPTSINAGTVRQAASGNGLGNGTISVNTGGTYELANASVSNGILVLNDGGTLRSTGLSGYSGGGHTRITNAPADVFINVAGASDVLNLTAAIRSAIDAPSSATIHVNGAGTLRLQGGGTSASDIFGGSWEQSGGILQVGQTGNISINALGFKNGDAEQANTVTVNGGTLAVGIIGGGPNTPPWLRANVNLNGGAIASTNGVTGLYGGDFTVSAASTSKVLLFDPASTATSRSVSLVAGAAGTENLAGSTTWGANSTLIVDPGTTTGGIFTIERTGGTISVGSNATLQINEGATLNLAGTADALSDGTNHVNVVNNSTTTFNVTEGSKNIGSLSGTGNTNISAGASLTMHQSGNTSHGAIAGAGSLIKEGAGTLTASSVAVAALTINNGAVNSPSSASIDSGESITVAGGSVSAPSIIDNGTLTVTSGTVTVDLLGVGNDGTLSGGSGTGQATVSGGAVSAKKVLLGSSAGGNGTLVVKDGGTLASEKLAANTLVVNPLGSVTITQPLMPDDPVMDGSVVAGYVHDGTVVVNHSSTLTTPKMKLGVTAGKTGTFVQNGGTVNVTTLGVGNDGTASGGEGIGIVALNGATPNVTNVIIGSSAGGVGDLTLGFPGPEKVLKTATLSIDAAAGNQLNLTDNKLIVTSEALGSWDGSSYSGITGMIASDKIISSVAEEMLTGLAAVTAGAVNKSTFGGMSVSPSDVLVMFTYAGDANLSGFVDADDYFQIDSNYNKPASSLGFFKGDFDLSGVIDGDDYALIDAGFSGQGAPFSASLPAGVTSVPEPGGLVAFLAAFVAARRKRRVDGAAKE